MAIALIGNARGSSITRVSRTRVKICGVCRVEDAIAAARLGADAIGMVFHAPSPRNVSLALAADILRALPPFVTPVGLFVDASPEAISDVTGRLGLRHVQLHGRETPETIAAVRGTVIKAMRVDPHTLPRELDALRQAMSRLSLHHLRGLVLETSATAEPGGTGVPNDWVTIRRLMDEGAFDGLPPIIAAGGLTPETVGDVVRTLRPWAVDVSSGVESARGQKSQEKLRDFFAAVHGADR